VWERVSFEVMEGIGWGERSWGEKRWWRGKNLSAAVKDFIPLGLSESWETRVRGERSRSRFDVWSRGVRGEEGLGLKEVEVEGEHGDAILDNRHRQRRVALESNLLCPLGRCEIDWRGEMQANLDKDWDRSWDFEIFNKFISLECISEIVTPWSDLLWVYIDPVHLSEQFTKPVFLCENINSFKMIYNLLWR
jgi:hypothetical protein